MKVLVDTSVWSLALRRGTAQISPEVQELRRLIDEGSALMVGLVRQELLSGIRASEQFERLRDQLRAFPDVPLETEDHEQAAIAFNLCRSRGIQGSNTDFLLCAVAARRGAAIFTTDLDFGHFTRALPVRLHSPRSPS